MARYAEERHRRRYRRFCTGRRGNPLQTDQRTCRLCERCLGGDRRQKANGRERGQKNTFGGTAAERGRFLVLQTADHFTAHRPADGDQPDHGPSRLSGVPCQGPGRTGNPLPGPAHQGHFLFPGSRGLRGTRKNGHSPALGGRGRADPHLGRRMRHGGGGLFVGHCPFRCDGRTGHITWRTTEKDTDLRYGYLRNGHKQGSERGLWP